MARVETLNAARSKVARKAAQLNARHAHGRTPPSLILMTDDERRVDWVEAAQALPRRSAIVVRHREPRAREALARALRPICAARRIMLLIADDAALAVRVRADGVHVPEKQAARIAALKALHPSWFVSTSAHGVRGVHAARSADAVLIAPAFVTTSHPGRHALGSLRMAALASMSDPPAFALGGIDAASVDRLATMRLSGVALIGGWTNV